MWYGSDEDAFFDFSTISMNRKIKYPMLPDDTSNMFNNPLLRIPTKQNGEIRILSADIALMSSKRHANDATAIFINRMTPTKAGRYISNIVYADTNEGLTTDAEALLIRRLFEEYQCDYLALDCAGVGLGIYDLLIRDIVNTDTGEIYPALSCYNNSDMADRCTVFGAPKVIWAIKASAQFNSDCAFLLREAFKSGRIRLLETDDVADRTILSELKGYKKLDQSVKAKILAPYVQTTLLIDELTKLQHEESGGKIRIYEKTGMRKDRYSSLAYNFYVATQVENKMVKRTRNNSNAENMFIIKPPNSNRKAVNRLNGRKNKPSWQ